MKQLYTLIAGVLLLCSIPNLTFAQAKKILYLTEQKTMDATLTADGNDPIANDPIIRMLKKDPNLSVTVKILSAADADVANFAIPEIATHDVIVIQESIGGDRNILKPGGTLALANLTKPTLYNKIFAFSNNRALGENENSADASTATAAVFSLTVPDRGLPLFSGLNWSNNSILLFTAGANDTGGEPGTGAAKAFSYNNSVKMSTANRPLATFPANGALSISETGTPLFFNDVPANTTLTGSTATTGYTLSQRVIFFGMNFGAMSRENGVKMSSAGYTMWRNAIYILAGLAVPNTMVTSSKPEVENAFFTLSQNYPNPSNGSTTITFELKKAGQVVLEVFNVTGRKVATLANGNKAAGLHEVKLESNNLKSGMYIYRLTTEGATAARTMVVTK